jgi:putative transposase
MSPTAKLRKPATELSNLGQRTVPLARSSPSEESFSPAAATPKSPVSCSVRTWDARVTLAAWRTDYNTERPHSRLGWQTPAAFAQTFAPQRGLTLRNPQGSAPAPVAQPAQTGKTKTQSIAHAG